MAGSKKSLSPTAVIVGMTLCLTSAGLCSATEAAAVHLDTIISPGGDTPTSIAPDNTFEVHLVLRLPLTPPPGVQQFAANKGWHVTLSRDDFSDHQGRPARLRYTFPIMRLRPFEKNAYRITVETAPWIPDGLYDLTVTGPGFHGEAKKSIRKGASTPDGNKSQVTPLSVDGGVDKPLPGGDRFLTGIVIPGSTPGVRLSRNGTPIPLTNVVPATLPDTGARLVMFEIERESLHSPPHTLPFALETVKAAPCNIDIDGESAGPNRALEWRMLTLSSPTPALSVIWQFGDGRFGEGNAVRHRFLLPNTATVTVNVYDQIARRCTLKKRIELNTIRKTTGCGCFLVGR